MIHLTHNEAYCPRCGAYVVVTEIGPAGRRRHVVSEPMGEVHECPEILAHYAEVAATRLGSAQIRSTPDGMRIGEPDRMRFALGRHKRRQPWLAPPSRARLEAARLAGAADDVGFP